jgi:hypothetical protein
LHPPLKRCEFVGHASPRIKKRSAALASISLSGKSQGRAVYARRELSEEKKSGQGLACQMVLARDFGKV